MAHANDGYYSGLYLNYNYKVIPPNGLISWNVRV